MPFDMKKFMGTHFVPREQNVPVPGLKTWFDDGEKPIWVVKGLTGEEIARANEAGDRLTASRAMIDSIASLNSAEIAERVKELLGLSASVPPELAKRIDHLRFGSVKPTVDQDQAVAISERYPIEFYELTNKILALSGKGMMPGKPQPSGKTPKSKQQ